MRFRKDGGSGFEFEVALDGGGAVEGEEATRDVEGSFAVSLEGDVGLDGGASEERDDEERAGEGVEKIGEGGRDASEEAEPDDTARSVGGGSGASASSPLLALGVAGVWE